MIRTLALLFAALCLTVAPAHAQTQQWSWTGVARVVAIGDLHGDYAKFEDQLTQAGLIDARGNWTGGRTHLVQLGDVPDRAADTRRILDHLMRLERQARRAGGYVHALIGNHEVMNVEGDLRYTTPGEFAAFADRNSARRRDQLYQRTLAALRAHPPASGLPVFDAAYRAQFDAQHPLGWIEHAAAWGPTGTYGRWIATHDAIIRIDDTLYMHGGISADYANADIGVMNDAIRAAVRAPQSAAAADAVLGDRGPLWYRGLAQNDEAAEAPNVAAVLAHFNVRHIVLGHTKQYSMVAPRFAGAVILTDIAVPSGYADPHAFLIKEGDTLTTVHRGHRVALRMSGTGLCAYYSEIAALDAAGSPNAALATQCTAASSR